MTGSTARARGIARFWERVDKTDTCWLWTAGRTSRGYGMVMIDGNRQYVHRFVYELLVGPIPDGALIDHKCRVRACVNPQHLQPVMHGPNAENRAGSQANSRSGVRGVYPYKGRWRAQACVDRKVHDGGVHDTIEEAEAAVIALRLRIMANNLTDRVV